MPKVPFGRPFRELKLTDEQRLQAPKFVHLLFRESFPPAPTLRFKQIDEWAVRNFKAAKSLKQALPRCGREAASCARTYINCFPS
jgi:hypothetical protein